MPFLTWILVPYILSLAGPPLASRVRADRRQLYRWLAQEWMDA